MTDRLTDEQIDVVIANLSPEGLIQSLNPAGITDMLLRGAREANRLERELARAMSVVNRALNMAGADVCPLCDTSVGDIVSEDDAHAQDCPLVTGGFVTPEGQSTK